MKCKIEKIVNGGLGLGFIGENQKKETNKKIFIPFVLENEIVEYEITHDSKNYCFGLPLNIITKSEDRVIPVCNVFYSIENKNNYCGGCDFMHIKYKRQIEYKNRIILEFISRNKLSKEIYLGIMNSTSEFDYRNKIQLPVSRTGNKLNYGFYMPYSHKIIQFKKCYIQDRKLDSILECIIQNKQFIPKNIRYFIMRVSDRTNSKDIIFVTYRTKPDELKTIANIINTGQINISGIYNIDKKEDDNMVMDGKFTVLKRNKYYEENFLGQKLVVPPDSFFQLNVDCAEKLFYMAKDLLKPGKDDVILDLYSGVGAFSTYISKYVQKVISIEESPSSIYGAKINAKNNNCSNIIFYDKKVSDIISNLRELKAKKLKIILDPPRTGLNEKIIDILCSLNPEKIIYVSCDPATFFRDQERFKNNNYNISCMRGYDFFPQTHHIELLTLFERSKS